MATYSLTINSTAAARAHAKEKGYKFVFAKGVKVGRRAEYSAAWFVLGPDDITVDSVTVNWTVNYAGNFSTATFKDGRAIKASGNDVSLVPGGAYCVFPESNTLQPDLNHRVDPKSSAFRFYNDAGYAGEYVPILKTAPASTSGTAPTGPLVPVWTARAGVTRGGQIMVTPEETVRVWLGDYNAGDAVLAEYSTVAVQFDLTSTRNGHASINDDLSAWGGLSDNATSPVADNVVMAVELLSPPPRKSPKLVYASSPATNGALLEDVSAPGPVFVAVLATFRYTITAGSITFLLSKFIDKFGTLRPARIEANISGVKMVFANRKTLAVLATLGSDAFEDAANAALTKAVADPASGLPSGETWTLSETTLSALYA